MASYISGRALSLACHRSYCCVLLLAASTAAYTIGSGIILQVAAYADARGRNAKLNPEGE